jgi:glucose/arabinose dehydrogenase
MPSSKKQVWNNQSITGTRNITKRHLFYSGHAIPEWKDNLFVASLSGQHIDRLVIKSNKVTGEERLLVDKNSRFRDVTYMNDMLYAITDDGDIYRISKK